MSGIHFGQDLFDEFTRVQRQMASLFGELPAGIRAVRPSAFPALNVGATDDAIEIVAFAPGMAAADFDVSIDKDLLTISGERKPVPHDDADNVRTYAQERFHGAFRRVVELPQDADADNVTARYENGCLLIRVGRREASKPRTITVQ
ncbi:Hsp20/alpha crystallin family protein [Burkholderia latens]|uniref:Heat-shock protein Hsp20 n=1 Tax=Burkholderia latens TaxID=488446 RepID=A0A6H9T1W7_9BURK|nr:Hsp20/alpha crystallin family protein [Burkholderia latens]KAB0631702.1 Hsp20/alpha crystallin family protein [Burkholderia latens]VWB45669.1 heat-shock protein Hsp20 [Burkholderia latens]